MAHEIIVKISPSGPASSARILTFSESPIRIGRNQLNDISIDDPFVSEWHGMIRFGDEGIAYADLGSTNGSVLDGVRLAKNVPAHLTDSSRILLGRIELAVSRRVRETSPQNTIAWGRAPKTDRPAGEGSAPRQIPEDRSSRSGAVAVAPPQEVPASDGARLRQQQILEAFSEAFVGLRKGYEQFGAEVGVRTISGRTPLHRARTSQAVLEHLLAPNTDIEAVKHDLIAVFADFGIHHIAMMAAVTEGVRALLQSLDPRANDLDGGGRLFSASKSKQQWKSFIERFDQILTDDEELHAVVFGPEFARAYARVTLRDGQSGTTPPSNKSNKSK